MNEIKLKVRGEDYVIRQSFRTYLLFEEMSSKQVSEISTIKDMLTLLYCTFKGCNKNWTYSFDEYIDIIDETPEIFEKFNQFNTVAADETQKKTTVKIKKA